MPAGPVEGQWVHVDDVSAATFDEWGDPAGKVYTLMRPRDLVPRAQQVRMADQLQMVDAERYMRHRALSERLFDIMGVIEIMVDDMPGVPAYRVKLRAVEE